MVIINSRRYAMHKRGTSRPPVSVRPSVRHIVSKRLNTPSDFLAVLVMPSFHLLQPNLRYTIIARETPIAAALRKGCVAYVRKFTIFGQYLTKSWKWYRPMHGFYGKFKGNHIHT